MSTKEAKARANAAWRARTSAKPVQVYLHADTLAQLDALVAERGAPGRAAVLTALIEAAAEAHQRPAEPAPVEASPMPAPAPRTRIRSPRAQERAVRKADLRRAARLYHLAGDEHGRRQAVAAWWERATPGERRKAPAWLMPPP